MSSEVCISAADCHEHEYDTFSARLRERFATRGGPFFRTDAADLWRIYLDNIPAEARQHYNCHACRHFIERHGGLVTIGSDGRTSPALWIPEEAPEFFRPAVSALARAVGKAKVVGVFLSDERVWGTPQSRIKATGWVWQHLHVEQANPCHTPTVQTLDQIMAEKVEDHGTLLRGLVEYPVEAVRKAKALLESEALYRSEHCLGVAKWLLDLHERRDAAKGSAAKSNVVWLAVATAPPGFCHVKTTMIGTLLDDLVADLPFDAIKRRFAEKMHPLQYQRPQAPPSDGNIEQAEKIIAQLHAAGALARRFARLEDVQALWRPREQPAPPPAEGVFGHLKAKQKPDVIETGAPPTVMTWEKFSRLVLPTAEGIDLRVPRHGGFGALVTAVNPDAPPILQWDSPEERNPVSHYFYHGGNFAERWGLVAGVWCKVTAICLLESMWGSRALEHQGKGFWLLLDGCRDVQHERGGGFFVETLRSEFHAVRRTLEAYALSASIAGKEEATACGLGLQAGPGREWDATLRVRAAGVVTAYKLDRWD